MKFLKKGCLQLNTNAGQVSLTVGAWIVILVAIILSGIIQIALFICTSQYLEDALAASNLAAMVIDIEEYGTTRRIRLEDREKVYDRFVWALKSNLNLDEDWECPNKGIIAGAVQIDRFIIYEVKGGEIRITDRKWDGSCWEGIQRLGEAYAPNGKLIEATGIYSEISCPVKGLFSLSATAHKAQLSDVTGKTVGEEQEEIRD